ncbi:MAG TPA: PspC domain-containing protein [Acidimicrobiales bacterium]|nr:PspC domain-containing protein [Acidimicrobiales bacterium]
MPPLCDDAGSSTIGDIPEPAPDGSGNARCDHRSIATVHDRPYRRLYRSADDKLVAGVASGLAEHLRVDVMVVRIAFALLAAAGGAGILAYAAFWVFVPMAAPSAAGAGAQPQHTGREQLPAIVALAAGGMVLAGISGVVFDSAMAWSLVVVAVGIGLIWRQADDARRARWASQARSHAGLRLALGAVFVGAGVAAFLASTNELEAARDGVVAIVVVLVGLALILGPWWIRLLGDLTEERRERIRSEERAEVATHVHDSVLQTLTLIQRHAEDPGEIRRLARIQERELRSWLYAPSTTPRPEGGLVAALEATAAEVEDRHRVRVEVVAVGDTALDDTLQAVVLAAREAMVNAAKFSGRDRVDVYAEVEPAAVTVFVRDTGAGFDPAAVPPDRRGIAESIVGRVARAGGTATVRSTAETGTEVELAMPR